MADVCRFALLQFDPGKYVLAAAAEGARKNVAIAESKELVCLLWSFAKLGPHPILPEIAALMDSAHGPLLSQLSDPTTQHSVSMICNGPSAHMHHVSCAFPGGKLWCTD